MNNATPTTPTMSDAELRRHIGREVKVAMLRRGIDQRSLASELQIGLGTLNGRLAGKTEFGTTELYHVAQFLDVDLWELYPDESAARVN